MVVTQVNLALSYIFVWTSWAVLPGMDEWCHRSCLSYPPHCPADKCQCLSHCDAVGRLAGQEGTDVFCHRKCLRFPPDCPEDLCRCYPAPASGVDQASDLPIFC